MQGILDFLLKRRLKPKYQENAKQNAKLFHKVLEQYPVGSVIVDASKQISRLMCLEQSGLFRVKVIHLVRDGRAVLFSHKRQIRARVERTRKVMLSRRKKSTVEHVFRWTMLNIMLMAVGKVCFPERYILVHYEDICLTPERSLNKIFEFAGLDQLDDFKKGLNNITSHIIGGNQMRFAKLKEIRLDSEYKARMRVHDYIGFQMIGGWLNSLMGYTCRLGQ
jgi:hypothetical protein